jgi:membrane protein
VPFLASALTFDALLAAIPFFLLLLIGLTHLAQFMAGGGSADPVEIFHRFLPPHDTQHDPFQLIEELLAGITRRRGELSAYAAPAFVWFSTRLFAGIRTSLNDIFDVSARPTRRRFFLIVFLLGKLRDVSMVVVTVVLFLANTVISAGIAVVQSRGGAFVTAHVPRLAFWVSGFGRLSGELLAALFSISLFFVTYKYASLRRLPWRTALLAATFTAVGFEIAKRLYAFYLSNFASVEGVARNATIGAAVLFVLWIYYTALVFLLGGVVAETWELRRMQRRQRAVLG